MVTLTLPIKAYRTYQLKLVDKFLKSTLRELQVETKINDITPSRQIQVTISGADEKAASHYVTEEIGQCPTRIEDVRRFSTYKGHLTSTRKNRSELGVDIGISSPEMIEAKILLQQLQAQLCDGRKVSLEKISELFGFCENFPVTIKISSIDKEKKQVEAMFSGTQTSQFENWTRSLLDRLIVIGSSSQEITLALNRARLNRDVIDVEYLGLFEHAVVCKLGTDGKGLIPKVGKSLHNASLSIFSPKRIVEFFGYSFLDD
jgi:hypothetical protein